MQDHGHNSDSAELRNLKRDAEQRIHSGESARSALQHEAILLRDHEKKHGHFSKEHYEHEMKFLKHALQHDGYSFSPNLASAPKESSKKGAVEAKAHSLPEIDNPFVDKHIPEKRKIEVPKLPEVAEKKLSFSPGKTGLLRNWSERHEALVDKAHSGVPDTAFFGDSITEGMSLNNSFKDMHGKTANFGIHGDTTENLRYRLEHGELEFKDGKAPKNFVMLVGTNDIDQKKSHAQIARDIIGDAEIIAHKFPQSKVLILGLLPRGGHQEDIADINAKLQKSMSEHHSTNIKFSDIGHSMLEQDGSMSGDIWQKDFEHPTFKGGYTRLLGAIKNSLNAEN